MMSDFYSKLNEQEKKIFYVAMIIVVLMVLDRMFLGPALSKMKSYDEEIAQQKARIQRDLRFITYKQQILDEDQILRPYYVSNFKTEEQIIAAFLKKLELMATETNINLIKITPAEAKTRKGFTEYFAHLECEGLLENIAAFMHRVDTSEDLLKIGKVSLSLKRASGDEVVVVMEVAKMIMESRPSPQTSPGGSAQGSSGSSTSRGQQGGAGAVGSANEASGSQASSGSGTGTGESPEEEKTLQVEPSSFSQEDEQVSQRYQMKGGLFTEKDQKKLQELEDKEPPIKKSVYERMMERLEKGSESDGRSVR